MEGRDAPDGEAVVAGAVESKENVGGLAEAGKERGGLASLEELFADAIAVPSFRGLACEVKDGEPFADEAL